MNLLLAAHAFDFVRLGCGAFGALIGLWAAFKKFRKLLQTEIREYAASKEDVARLEGKMDIVVSALLKQRSERRKVIQ